MTNPWLLAILAVFIWWASTGAILWRVRRADLGGRDAHVWSVLLGLPLLLGGFLGLHATAPQSSVSAAFTAFLAAIAVWGWIELSFLSGIVTGPNRSACPALTPLPARFWKATASILWHEILLIVALGAVALIAAQAANPFGFYTFAMLFGARISAKLNLFLGVPRIHTEFLPRPLAHLASHFRRAPMSLFFPVSALALGLAAGFWLHQALHAADEAAFTGYVLVTVLTALALLEHLFMVLPLPDQKLWTWMLPRDRRTGAGQPHPQMPHPPMPHPLSTQPPIPAKCLQARK